VRLAHSPDEIIVKRRSQLQDRSHRSPRRCSARISAGRRLAGISFHDHVPPRAAQHNASSSSPPTGDGQLKEETSGVASVLAKAKKGPHFARCAAFGQHEARKEDEIDSAFRLLRHVTNDRPQFVELLRGDH
jgi:hypothetical protein